MKLFYIFLLFFFSFIYNIFAQSPNWAWANSSNTVGCSSCSPFTRSTALTTDLNGNTIVIGNFNTSSITFGSFTLTNTNSPSNDVFIVKYDPSGNVLWAKNFFGIGDEYIKGLSTDASGNIIITGSFSSPTITLGSITFTKSGVYNFFVVKLNPNGNILWAKSNNSAKSEGHNVAIDASNNIIITGFFSSSSITFDSYVIANSNTGFSDIFILKYDPSGNLIWAKSAGGTDSEDDYGISTDANNNIFVRGWVWSNTITFGSTTYTKNGLWDMFLAKYDNNGNLLWVKFAGGTSQYGDGITADSNGNVIVCGSFYTPTILFGTTTLINTGNNNLYVVKYDPNGNVVWVRSNISNNLAAKKISVDISGNIYVTGTFLNPFSYSSIAYSNIGQQDIFIFKYDSNGNEIWAKVIGGTMGDVSSSIYCDLNGNILITGNYSSPTITLGLTTLFNSIINSNGDIFIAKLSSLTSVNTYYKTSVYCSPNPTNGRFVINGLSVANIEVYNIYGALVKTIDNNIEIDLSSFTQGIYIIKCFDNKHQLIHTDKVLKQD